MTNDFAEHFNASWINHLLTSSMAQISGVFVNTRYFAKIGIRNYKQRIEDNYTAYLGSKSLDHYCNKHQFPQVFTDFGVIIEFESAVELYLHDDEMKLDQCVNYLIEKTGAIIIKNAYFNANQRLLGHRNRFPHLNFHVDRSPNQPTHFSMYTRNPFDAEQKFPRISSTLFVASVVGQLQSSKEQQVVTSISNRSSYEIFINGSMEPLFNDIILKHAWDAPMGTGEISIIDNITCLHSSYYPNQFEKGYKIGVRYVA